LLPCRLISQYFFQFNRFVNSRIVWQFDADNQMKSCVAANANPLSRSVVVELKLVRCAQQINWFAPRSSVSCLWTSFAHFNRSGWRMILSAVSGIKMVKRMSATLDETRKLAPAAAGRWF
jgi:hypothetical protein